MIKLRNILNEDENNEFNRAKAGYYNAWNLDQVEHTLEIIEDNLSKLKSNLSTDSNLTTNDKLRYIHIIDNIEAELNSAQEDLNFKPMS